MINENTTSANNKEIDGMRVLLPRLNSYVASAMSWNQKKLKIFDRKNNGTTQMHEKIHDNIELMYVQIPGSVKCVIVSSKNGNSKL